MRARSSTARSLRPAACRQERRCDHQFRDRQHQHRRCSPASPRGARRLNTGTITLSTHRATSRSARAANNNFNYAGGLAGFNIGTISSSPQAAPSRPAQVSLAAWSARTATPVRAEVSSLPRPRHGRGHRCGQRRRLVGGFNGLNGVATGSHVAETSPHWQCGRLGRRARRPERRHGDAVLL
jgi:hypothetical protein